MKKHEHGTPIECTWRISLFTIGVAGVCNRLVASKLVASKLVMGCLKLIGVMSIPLTIISKTFWFFEK